MKISVRCKSFEGSEHLAEHVISKVHQHLSRFGHRVSAVEARMSDVNGPRGGRDKRCVFTVRVLGSPPIHVEELHESIYAATDLAMARVEEAVARSIERSRWRQAAALDRRPS
jgi:putative sigma-54 modulation protein